MGGVTTAVVAALSTAWGLALLAALDASVVFFLPLAVDVVVVSLVARDPARFWLYPLLATAGSLAGGAVTWWLGARLGSEGLGRLVPAARLQWVRDRVERQGAVALALAALIPPPFPFTLFELTAGALAVPPVTFLATLAAARLARFGVESVLARTQGERIIGWMESDPFRWLVIAIAVAAVAGTAWSVWSLWKRSRTGRPQRS